MTAFEELASEHCDQLLPLDEIDLLGADAYAAAAKAYELAYVLGNGSGKYRSRSFGISGSLRQRRLLGFGTGEFSINELASQAGRKRLKGDLVRLIDIP